MKKRNTGKRKGRHPEYRQIGTGTQKADEVVYTSSFRTRQKFGAASAVRHISVPQVDVRSVNRETVVRCDCGHEVSEADFFSLLPSPKPINNLAYFDKIAHRLNCKECNQIGRAQVLNKICY